MFCTQDCLTGLTEQQRVSIISRIRRKVGAPVLTVELLDEQIEECICESIEEYSSFINGWVLKNRLGEMLGLPSDVDFTLKYVSNSLYFEKSFAASYSQQQGFGANGISEIKTDSITLTAYTQDYTIPANREVNEILWFTPSFINLFGLDPFANNNIDFSEFGASFAGQTLFHVMPVYDTVMTAQAAGLRNRVRGSEYSYIMKPGPAGTKVLKLLPIPVPNNASANYGAAGIGGGVGTPGVVFYTYVDRVGNYGNPLYSGFTANAGFTGFTGPNSATTQGNGLVSSPADAGLEYISFAQLNSVAQTWIKKYAQALAKELLGVGIRGKFKGQIPVPGAELTLNGDDLQATGREDQANLKTQLLKDLDDMSFKNIMENKAAIQEAIQKTLSYGPMGIWIF